LHVKDSKIHTILTNRAHIGLRTIKRRRKAEWEKVPLAWKPITGKELFQQVQEIMAGNNGRTHRNGGTRGGYLPSRILPRGKCPEGGHDRIEMQAVDTTVLDCLSDRPSDGGRFERLEAEEKLRLSSRSQVIQRELQRFNTERMRLEDETEDRNREHRRHSESRAGEQ